MINTFKNSLYCFATLMFVVTSPVSAIPIGGGDDGDPAWIAQYFVNSTYAKVGKPVTVQWQSFNSVGCSIWTNQTGSRVVGVSGSTSVTPTSASTMSVRLSCAGTNGQTTSQTRSFSVNRADHPELNSLTVSQESADAGSQITLSWSSSFSDFCELTGTNTDTLSANGSRSFVVQQGTNTFTVKCKSNDGRTSNTRIETVSGRSILPSINSFYISVPAGSLQYFTVWFADAEFCSLDAFSVGTSGSRGFFKPSFPVPVTHQLTCHKNGYTVSRSATYRP